MKVFVGGLPMGEADCLCSNRFAEQPFTSDALHQSQGYVDGQMLQRHCLKDFAPAPHKVPGFLLHGISSQCADCRLLSSLLRFQRAPTVDLHTLLPTETPERSSWPHEVTLPLVALYRYNWPLSLACTRRNRLVSAGMPSWQRSGWWVCWRLWQPHGSESQANQYRVW
jgi:hypothetical protein